MSVIACIPVRYGSTRLPAKPLISIDGKPLVLHVAERAAQAKLIDDLIILTDHPLILETVEKAGFKATLTSDTCRSGSDRIVDYIQQGADADVFVNVQGDELLLEPQHIDQLVKQFQQSQAQVATLAHWVDDPMIAVDPSTAKIVTDIHGNALYFSRQAIPTRQDGSPPRCLVQIGMYIYTREAILNFAQLAPGYLEQIEKLEQLRFLENNIPLKIIEVDAAISLSIDTIKDLEKAEAHFA